MKNHVTYNPNPAGKNVGDCAVRALSKALDIDWKQAKVMLDVYSFDASDMETSDDVWGRILYEHGFDDYMLKHGKEQCTLDQFCDDHPTGTYVCKLPGHVVCVRDGKFYDTWDSGSNTVIYYWTKCANGECGV